jgi:formamidopyrimidine-DNA glycosylase
MYRVRHPRSKGNSKRYLFSFYIRAGFLLINSSADNLHTATKPRKLHSTFNPAHDPMPELPEVETTLRGIKPHIENVVVEKVLVRESRLRWAVSANLKQALSGHHISKIDRRAKYLLLKSTGGTVLIHLGMSGSLAIVAADEPVRKHDHVDFCLAGGKVLRFHDPRRFGCILWLTGDPEQHPLLADLGPEPLSDTFTGEYLFARSRKRKVPIKSYIMDGRIVVGVGNIYANEALFAAGIAPKRMAGTVSKNQYEALAAAIKAVLAKAITAGGTTLRDFTGGDGKPGYFRQELLVYGRGAEPCLRCGALLSEIRLGQRTTVYCRKCQR